MSLLPATADYTDKDFSSLRLRLQALVKSVFPTWSDFNTASFAEILLELFAFTGSVVTFYMDNQGAESRLSTATQRRNVINIAKMLGYAPRGATAAVVTEVFSLSSIPTHPVTLAAGTKIATASVTSPVVFQLLADLVIAAGTNPPVGIATIENSAFATDSFPSTGQPSQAIILSGTPYLDGSSSVSASDGPYTQVDNFLASVSTDRHYVVQVDQNDRATFTFGDGVSGSVPNGLITVAYKTGGGTAGNVEAGTITKPQGSFTDAVGTPVIVSATNPQRPAPGTDRETIGQIQVNAPAAYRATTRSVANDDFEVHATLVPGVARALMTTIEEDPSLVENTGILYIVPTTGGAPSAPLIAAVVASYTTTYPKMNTFRVSVLGASYLAVNVSARVYKVKGFTTAQVGSAIRAALVSFFAILNPDQTPNQAINFGGKILDTNGNVSPTLNYADLFKLVDDVTGVRKVGAQVSDFLLNNAHADVTLLTRQFPVLGTVSLIDADTGGLM